jgi:hypothetical protein
MTFSPEINIAQTGGGGYDNPPNEAIFGGTVCVSYVWTDTR